MQGASIFSAYNPLYSLAGFFVGMLVGLTGVGGGSLMTPILVLLFKVDVGTAVTSDLLAALVMKPVGGGVHIARKTVRWDLVRWLCIGSIPGALSPPDQTDRIGRRR